MPEGVASVVNMNMNLTFNDMKDSTKCLRKFSILCVVVYIVKLLYDYDSYISDRHGYAAKTIVRRTFYRHLNKTNNKTTTQWEFLIDTGVCKIVNIDPLDITIRHLINKNPVLRTCENRTLMTYVHHGKIYLNTTVGRKMKVSYCKYRTISKSGNSFKLTRWSQRFDSFIPIESEFVYVECYDSIRSVLYTNVHFNFIRKRSKYSMDKTATIHEDSNDKTTNSMDKNTDRLNVLLILLDSVSRINSLRFLKKTRHFLIEKLKAIEMLGYNKVADNTLYNMVPLMLGKFVHEFPCLKNKSGVDDCPFIWKKYFQNNYITHFAEDWPTTGTFTYALAGFKNTPTDYFDNPFHAANEGHTPKNAEVCFHGKMTSERLYERMYDLAYNLKDERVFSFSGHCRIPHETVEGIVDLDAVTKTTLSELYSNNLLNNTFLAIFGDHGMRFGNVRKTFIGQLEERLPMMFIYLPDWFRNKYKHFTTNLKTSSNRLTTHFDMHQTLLHLLSLNNPPSDRPEKGISLFREIPHNRTCDDAHIPPFWCACNYHLTKDVNESTKRTLADSFVSHLNELLFDIKHLCEKLSVKSIIYALKVVYGETTYGYHGYRIAIETTPGDGVFETMIKYNFNLKKYYVVGDISRINKYSGQSDCIDDKPLRKICRCKVSTKYNH